MIGLNEVVLSHVFGSYDENIAVDEDVDLLAADDDVDLMSYSAVPFAVYCMSMNLSSLEHSLLAWTFVGSDSFQACFFYHITLNLYE